MLIFKKYNLDLSEYITKHFDHYKTNIIKINDFLEENFTILLENDKYLCSDIKANNILIELDDQKQVMNVVLHDFDYMLCQENKKHTKDVIKYHNIYYRLIVYIYNILIVKNSHNTTPSKDNCLFYEYFDNLDSNVLQEFNNYVSNYDKKDYDIRNRFNMYIKENPNDETQIIKKIYEGRMFYGPNNNFNSISINSGSWNHGILSSIY